MTKPNPATNRKAASANDATDAHWKQTFGEPPPVTASERLMAEIIDECTARQDLRREAREACDGSR